MKGLPLSFAQQRIWRLAQMPSCRMCQTRVHMRLRGALNQNALRAALDRLVARHETLRTTFRTVSGRVLQDVASPDVGFSLGEYRTATDRDGCVPFDLESGPLIRGELAGISADEHLLTIEFHPIVADTWSVGVLVREVMGLYAACCTRSPDAPSPLDCQLRPYVLSERGQMSEEKRKWRREYWGRLLADMPGRLHLPGRKRGVAPGTSSIERVPVRLTAGLYGHLRALAHRRGIPLFVPLLCGWSVLLGRWAERDDVVIGTHMANRSSPELERLMGSFENLVAIRIRFQGQTTVDQLLREVKTLVRKARSHQEVSFEEVAEHVSHSSERPHALQVLMNVNATPREVTYCAELSLPGLQVTDISIETSRSDFELSLSIDEGPGGLCGTLEYARTLFDRETIERMLNGWELLLGEMVVDIYQPVSRLPVMTEWHKTQVITEFNRTATSYRERAVIQQLFEQQVERTPEAVALEHEGRRLTYAQLNRRANQLARYLVSQGVLPDQVVGICVERGLEMVVGLLGVLKAGGASLLLDPNIPSEQLKHVLEDARPQLVLSETELVGLLPVTSAKVMLLDAKLGQMVAFIDEDLQPAELGLTSENLAHVIYTSGSKEGPKGTAMRHRSMVNVTEWYGSAFGAGQGQRVLQFAALGSDTAFQEIFSTLCAGGTLVLLDDWIRRHAVALSEFLDQHAIQRVFLTPLMLQRLAEYCGSVRRAPTSLKDVISVGEQLRVSTEIRLLFRRLANCRLHNHYTCPETHVATAFTLEADSEKWPDLPPIGRPIANTQIYVLDGDMQALPIGVAGEIYIGGANVAKGYLNSPDVTEQRFVADPYGRAAKARVYKTDDLGRWGDDGMIEYLGRRDDQVKIGGSRVELREIESQLVRHSRVKQGLVVPRAVAPGEKQLVAYVTPQGDESPSAEDLRAHLQALLPDYMLPTVFIVLAELPMAPSGKLDRGSLPVPGLDADKGRGQDPPIGRDETIVAKRPSNQPSSTSRAAPRRGDAPTPQYSETSG